jgi:hypothetical protein
MDKYDRPVGIGPLITVDTTRPVYVAAAACTPATSPGHIAGT